MRWNDEITLIAIQQPEQPVDANGFPQPPSEEKRTLFANVRKVGMTEFYEAQRAGNSVSLTVEVYTEEYDGQVIAEYDGRRYAVTRTYLKGTGDITELTLSDLKEGA